MAVARSIYNNLLSHCHAVENSTIFTHTHILQMTCDVSFPLNIPTQLPRLTSMVKNKMIFHALPLFVSSFAVQFFTHLRNIRIHPLAQQQHPKVIKKRNQTILCDPSKFTINIEIIEMVNTVFRFFFLWFFKLFFIFPNETVVLNARRRGAHSEHHIF